MGNFIIAGIGEILWDVVADSETLGGAPVNFAYHANNLGGKGYAISAIGNDGRGGGAFRQLEKYFMERTYIRVLPEKVTGYVLAEVDDEGVASYHFPDDVAWDNLVIDSALEQLAPQCDAVCFGSLAQRSEASKDAINNFLSKTKPKCLRVFDINLRQNFYTKDIIQSSLRQCNVVKLNDEEIVVLQGYENFSGNEEEFLKELVQRYSLMLAILTKGDSGSVLVTTDSVSTHPGYSTEVVDTIGAGDSFTATVVMGLLNNRELDYINDHANRVASIVCTQKGAMVSLPDNLRSI